jgi:hypothetical protein
MVGICIYVAIAVLVFIVLRKLDGGEQGLAADLIASVFWPLSVIILLIVIFGN